MLTFHLTNRLLFDQHRYYSPFVNISTLYTRSRCFYFHRRTYFKNNVTFVKQLNSSRNDCIRYPMSLTAQTYSIVLFFALSVTAWLLLIFFQLFVTFMGLYKQYYLKKKTRQQPLAGHHRSTGLQRPPGALIATITVTTSTTTTTATTLPLTLGTRQLLPQSLPLA